MCTYIGEKSRRRGEVEQRKNENEEAAVEAVISLPLFLSPRTKQPEAGGGLHEEHHHGAAAASQPL